MTRRAVRTRLLAALVAVAQAVVLQVATGPASGSHGPLASPSSGQVRGIYGDCRAVGSDPCGRRHQGYDVHNDIGTPIYAVYPGTTSIVTDAPCPNSGSLSGNMVRVHHVNGYKTLYMHLDTILVGGGQFVVKGQILGTMGATGSGACHTSPHLHFEVRRNDVPLDINFALPRHSEMSAGIPIPAHFELGAAPDNVIGNPAVGRNQDGRLEVFTRATGGGIWHKWQTSPNGAWTPSWTSRGGVLRSDPFVAHNNDGRLEVFARGTDNAIWHTWQTAPNGAWSGWASLGGSFKGNPVQRRNIDGRLEVFARGTDDAIWHNWQTSPGGGWSGWYSLGGRLASDPSATLNSDGRLEVFARGTDNALWHIWQTSAGGGWSGWSSLGGIVNGTPGLARNTDGRIEAFIRARGRVVSGSYMAPDGQPFQIWQTSPGGGWSGWQGMGGVLISDMTLGVNSDGRLEAFGRGTDTAVYHKWQMCAGCGWSGWSGLGGRLASETAVGHNADGRLEVFALGMDARHYQIWQTSPGGGWSGWKAL